MDLTSVVFFGSNQRGLSMKNLSITAVNAIAIHTWRIFDSLIENVIIENCVNDRGVIYLNHIDGDVKIKNLIMRNNVTQEGEFGIRSNMRKLEIDGLQILNSCKLAGVPVGTSVCGALDIAIADTLIMKNCRFVNNRLHNEEGTANFRLSDLIS